MSDHEDTREQQTAPEAVPESEPELAPEAVAEAESTDTPEPGPTDTPEPEPATTSEPEPATTSEPEPATTSEPEPATTSEPEPATTSEPEPATTSEPEPATTSEPEPATTSEPEPATTSEPEPATTSEPEPATTSEPEPATTSEPEPATTSEPESGDAPEPESGDAPEPEWPAEDPPRHRREIPAVLVRHRVPGQNAEYDAGKLELSPRMQVVLDSDRGQTVGTVIREPKFRRSDKPLRRVVRVVTDEDERVMERNRVREREAFHFCVERIKARELPMKLVSVDLAHSGTRAVFYFSSADRVDFRALVKDLARRFHTRIEMRQIGVRDASRHTGGIGICGRELCCATWLPGFKPISIRMAKDQNLALNHQKLSGLCGRLRCCLQYEQEIYQKQRKGLPKVGKRVITPQGEGRVKDVNVLRRRVRVQLAEGGYEQFDADEVQRPGDTPPPQKPRPARDEREPAAKKTTPPRERRADGSGDPPGAPQPEPAQADAPRAGSETARPNDDGSADSKPRPKRRRRRRSRRGRSRKSNKSGGGGNKPTDG